MPSPGHDCPPAPLAPPPPEPAAPSAAVPPAPPAASAPPLFFPHATAAISRSSASPCTSLMPKAYTGSTDVDATAARGSCMGGHEDRHIDDCGRRRHGAPNAGGARRHQLLPRHDRRLPRLEPQAEHALRLLAPGDLAVRSRAHGRRDDRPGAGAAGTRRRSRVAAGGSRLWRGRAGGVRAARASGAAPRRRDAAARTGGAGARGRPPRRRARARRVSRDGLHRHALPRRRVRRRDGEFPPAWDGAAAGSRQGATSSGGCGNSPSRSGSSGSDGGGSRGGAGGGCGVRNMRRADGAGGGLSGEVSGASSSVRACSPVGRRASGGSGGGFAILRGR